MKLLRHDTKRLTALLLVFALVFSQLAISAHNVMHPAHNVAGIMQDVDQDHEEINGHECPEYILQKLFQSAQTADGSLELDVFPLAQAGILPETPHLQSITNRVYQARAPPVFLI